MLTERLKERTARVHQESEKKMIRALKRIDTTEEYMQMLNWLYGFYAPIEVLVYSQCTPELFPDIEKRCRAEFIRWDMKESGIPPLPPDICNKLPTINSFPRALGALAAAEETFLTFKNWIDSHELQPQS